MTPSVLTKAKAQLVLQEPFYAAILLQLEVVLTEKIGDRDLWMAATDGAKLYINPKNFEQLSLAKAKGVLKHEVMHVAQMHPFRGEGKEARRWNHATDSAINPIIFDEGGELPDGVLTGAGFKGMTAEQIYAQLPPEPPGQGGGRGNQQNPMDDDVVPAPDKSQAAQDKAKVMISQAASVAAAMGKLPAHVKEALDEILSPKVDWTEYLRTWLTEVSPSDYSFARPNRRFIAGGFGITISFVRTICITRIQEMYFYSATHPIGWSLFYDTARYERFFFTIIKLRCLLGHNLVENKIRSSQNIFVRPEILRQINAALNGIIYEPIRIILVHK